MRKFLSFTVAIVMLLFYHPPVHAFHDESLSGINRDRVPGTFTSNQPFDQEPPTQLIPSPSKLDAKVIRVIDGVTIEVDLPNGKRESVRLLQIDIPEADDDHRAACGPEAVGFIRKMALGKTVQLELDVPERDQEGRLLAYVYVNGKSVQQALLNEGLAKVALHPSNGKYVDQYQTFEDHAKMLKKGIWAPAPCEKEDKTKRSFERNESQETHNNQGSTVEQPKSGNSGGRLPKTGTQYPTHALLGAGILLIGLLIRRRAA